ncbi:hypothetical protein QYM36_003570 [Artemia franciscana]|uniref:DDE Tnp4 domain-containing protein n=1 Tax=Artemia franciscana TaxID=6661 RepID=A0AA88I036_ARTSF|nr:hypothetical protein QYM36_003570 [Artemia franciscana]
MADVLVGMASSLIKWPEGQHAQNVREHFNKMSEFSEAIGCIDGTHIPIPAPTEHNFHIIRDSAYPLSPYLLTPYRETGNLTRYQQNYKFRHSSTRMTIDRAFGHQKGRFLRLQFFPSPDIAFICKSVISCRVLHNICVDSSELIPVDAENYRDPSLTNSDFDVRLVENIR